VKHLRYLSYVLRHKWHVMRECFKHGLYWRGITHDLSKFRPSEWIPYVENFYGKPKKAYSEFPAGLKYQFDCWKLSKEYWDGRFDMAWLEHIHRNPHHWQHYILREDEGATKILPMPYDVAVEMVCDWRGASRAITGSDNTLDWYTKNRDKMRLDFDTRLLVERLIGYRGVTA
jgi:hypothetical protein